MRTASRSSRVREFKTTSNWTDPDDSTCTTARKGVLYPIRSESVSEQNGDYVAAVAQDYCLMWSGGKDGDTKLGYEFSVVEPGLNKP